MKLYIKSALLLLLTLSCGILYAQNQGQAAIDSLLKVLPKAKEDTGKVKLLERLSDASQNINPDEGIKYGQQGLALAAKLEWKKGMAMTNNSLGNNYLSKSEYTEAMEHFLKALKINEETGDKNGVAVATSGISLIYQFQSNYPRALEYCFKTLKMQEESGNNTGIARTNMNIGNVYNMQSDYEQALAYYSKALKMFEASGNKTGIAGATGNMGSVYQDQGNYPKALDCYFKALRTDEETGDKKGIETALGNIGNIYKEQGDYPLALEYYFKALKIDEEIGDKKSVAGDNGNIGVIYRLQNDYPRALEYEFRALKTDEEIGDKESTATETGNIANIYIKQRNYTMAIEYAERALRTNEEIGDKGGISTNLCDIGECFLSIAKDAPRQQNTKATIKSEVPMTKYTPTSTIPAGKKAQLHRAIDYLQRSLVISTELRTPGVMQACYANLAEAYKLDGDYKKALEAADNYRAIKDSVFSKENKEKIVRLEMKGEYDQQHLTDSLRATEKEKIAKLQLQRQTSYTYVGVAGILLLAGFSFFIFKERGKSEKERKKSDGLLLNILPAEVANELKANGATTAKHYDNVTVLFTDFVNFTSAGERMSPQKLIDELHACFKAFDEITGKYNIEKIKTIGDAYLAVCGLPTAVPQHAEHTARAAIEINAFMQDRLAKLGNNTFEIRIGIHSGSVVAGIVGVKKFAYDIWGDTVNTAARMEQNSEAGKINISATTYDLVKDKFTCEYRGEIDAKGKGMVKMYYVS